MGLQRLGEESGGRMRQGWFEARGEGWRGPEGLAVISLKLRVHRVDDNGFVTNSNERMSTYVFHLLLSTVGLLHRSGSPRALCSQPTKCSDKQ